MWACGQESDGGHGSSLVGGRGEAILLLRSIYTSGDWEAYWEAYRGMERERLYGKTLNALGYPHQDRWMGLPQDDSLLGEEVSQAIAA